MCDYCGCLNSVFIAELSQEHERIALAAGRLAQALAGDDRAAATVALHAVVQLLGPHTRREEELLFPELARAGASAHTTALERDHADLDAIFASALDGDAGAWDQLPTALDRLHDHIWREDYDVFPASLQLLDSDAWERITHRRDAAIPT